MTRYGRDYYRQLTQGSRQSAKAVVPLMMDLLSPASVVDVGCGTGEWLAVFQDSGVKDVVGIDGPWVRPDQLQFSDKMFQALELSRPFTLPRTFDLALCLQVAEHLDPGAASSFIQSLVALAPAIAFSAAIPFQGGEHHVNEQWPDYWQGLFRAAGYSPIDYFRSELWDNPAVQPYIAQNLWLYASPALLASNYRLRELPIFPTRVVHPGVYQIPSLRRFVRQILSRRGGR